VSKLRSYMEHLVYIPHILVLSLSVIGGKASDEPTARLWYYIVPLPIFVVQLIKPTTAGWWAAWVSWLVCLLALVLPSMTTGSELVPVLALGLLALVPLFFLRPQRGKDPRNTAGL